MNKIMYVFDVDGTLTPSRQKIDPDFSVWFKKYFNNRRYCIVTGSDIKKVREQLDGEIINNAKAVFACSGNVIYSKGKTVVVNEFKPKSDLITDLGDIMRKSRWTIRTGNHIEPRNGLVNFSIVGRNCNDEQRQKYYEWDKKHKERKEICKNLKQKYPDLTFEIGGEISIDIYPNGKDKSQILQYLKEYTIFFFGDGIEPGKNDWSLAQALSDDSKSFKVNDWQDTKKKLTEILQKN
jgi:phosphomannomutase